MRRGIALGAVIFLTHAAWAGQEDWTQGVPVTAQELIPNKDPAQSPQIPQILQLLESKGYTTGKGGEIELFKSEILLNKKLSEEGKLEAAKQFLVTRLYWKLRNAKRDIPATNDVVYDYCVSTGEKVTLWGVKAKMIADANLGGGTPTQG